jgi:hypothetical protein
MSNSSLSRLVNRLLGRRSPDEYRQWLLKFGRIVEGHVLDATEEGAQTVIHYYYNISNVRYESSQALTPEQGRRRSRYVPGAAVSVRFDPRRPGQAIVE